MLSLPKYKSKLSPWENRYWYWQQAWEVDMEE